LEEYYLTEKQTRYALNANGSADRGGGAKMQQSILQSLMRLLSGAQVDNKEPEFQISFVRTFQTIYPLTN